MQGCFNSVLTDVLPSVDFLEDINLLHRRLSDLLDLLRGRLVRGSDVNDLHRVLLRCPLVDAATHHTAHSPEDEKTPQPSYQSAFQLLISSEVHVCTAGSREENLFVCFTQEFL